MTDIIVDSNLSRIGQMNEFTTDEIKNEPMLFNCSGTWAYENGGPLTRNFLDNLGGDLDKYVVDSRVHMLMPGWYPCIPGWHHDDVPRSLPNGQPNYIDPEYRSKHYIALVGAEVSPTRVAIGKTDLPLLTENVYANWNDIVEEKIEHGALKEKVFEDRVIYLMDDQTLHTGQKAQKNGWRFFIRASFDTDRVDKVTNEIRRQVQVYLDAPMAGW